MQWLKFWEWEIWKEEEPTPLQYPSVDQDKIAYADPIDMPVTEEEVQSANPQADRIRQSLLALRS